MVFLMSNEEFEKFLNRNKAFRDLDDIYKTPKFLKLYLKMYEYILSISKKADLVNYIVCFLKAHDFYHWRVRIYELVNSNRHMRIRRRYELLYGQKAKEFFDERIDRMLASFKNTNLKKYGTEFPLQSEVCQAKFVNTCMRKYGVRNPYQASEKKQKIIQTNLERYGVKYTGQSEQANEKRRQSYIKHYGCEYPFQAEEVKKKIEKTNLERYGSKNPNGNKGIRDKIKQTNLERCGCGYPWLLSGGHSRIADEFCMELYTKLSDNIKPYCIFFKKSNKEYMLEGNDKIFKYDFTIFMESIKVIVEFDGMYWHGLLEGQKYVLKTPVEEVWRSDYEKQRLAEMNGFKVIRVREDEYMEDKNKCIENIIKEIMDGVSSK